MPLIGPLDLGPLNTLRLTAKAERAWRLDDIGELDALADHLRLGARQGQPLVLGGGSNLLLARDLAEPLVLVRLRGRRVLGDEGDRVVIEVAAGECWDEVVHWTTGLGLWGLENLALIPGTAGAAPWQNIGAYGVELDGAVVGVTAWNLDDGRTETFDREACAFAYRDSRFRRPGGASWLILSVQLALSRRPRARLDYGEIRAELAAAGALPADGRQPGAELLSPGAVAQAVSRIRRRKLPDPAVIGNAGSFFKNPVITEEQADGLAARAPSMPAAPRFTAAGGIKTSAAWLIEACGWKGHRHGDAGVSPNHALVLVNYGRATGAEMLALAARIRDSVRQRFDIELEIEPRIVQ